MSQISTLLADWLRYFDPIHRGWTRAGIANGVTATCGFSFPRIRGGYLLRRSIGEVPDETSEIVGAAGADAKQVRTFPWVTHEPDTSYDYRLTSISGGGVENWRDVMEADVVFDAGGQWIGATPTTPLDLSVEPIAEGRFRLEWVYGRCDASTAPALFRVYTDSGTGMMDESQPVGQVAYLAGKAHYSFESAGFADGSSVAWLVRAASATGVEEQNTNIVSAIARNTLPPGHPPVIATCREIAEFGVVQAR